MEPVVDAHGVRRKVKRSERLRARLAKAMFGPDARIEKPTAEEYREITSGDHRH